jgi:hypothetical protein
MVLKVSQDQHARAKQSLETATRTRRHVELTSSLRPNDDVHGISADIDVLEKNDARGVSIAPNTIDFQAAMKGAGSKRSTDSTAKIKASGKKVKRLSVVGRQDVSDDDSDDEDDAAQELAGNILWSPIAANDGTSVFVMPHEEESESEDAEEEETEEDSGSESEEEDIPAPRASRRTARASIAQAEFGSESEQEMVAWWESRSRRVTLVSDAEDESDNQSESEDEDPPPPRASRRTARASSPGISATRGGRRSSRRGMPRPNYNEDAASLINEDADWEDDNVKKQSKPQTLSTTSNKSAPKAAPKRAVAAKKTVALTGAAKPGE